MTSFRLRSPVRAPRRGVERELLRAARGGRRDGLAADTDTGNSDHRELELAGMRALKLGTLDNACRHLACDRPTRLRRGAFRSVVPVLLDALSR